MREEAKRSPLKTPGSSHPLTSCPAKELLLLLLPTATPACEEAKVCVLGLTDKTQTATSSRFPCMGFCKERVSAPTGARGS